MHLVTYINCSAGYTITLIATDQKLQNHKKYDITQHHIDIQTM